MESSRTVIFIDSILLSAFREAAGLKVSDLRTMVGERYRDLLAAADSIVRMRTSAEKLVERLDRVESGVGGVGGSESSPPAEIDLETLQN